MKTTPNRFLSTLLFLLCGISSFAQTPPPPTGPIDPRPDLPIDDNLYILFALALILGIYFIYKHKLHKKTPT
jgi:hypothetical protein